MQLLSDKIKFKHSIILFQRKGKQSAFQMLPSIMFSFLFSQIYFTITNGLDGRNYIWIYLFNYISHYIYGKFIIITAQGLILTNNVKWAHT